MPKAVGQDSMLMSPAERADVIVDFTGYQGVRLFLINEGPDEPFGGGTPGVDFPFADPAATTGQVLKFVVDLPLSQPDTSVDPASLYLPSPPRLGVPSVHRRVALLEEVGNGGPRAALLGKAEGQGPTAMPEAPLEPSRRSERPVAFGDEPRVGGFIFLWRAGREGMRQGKLMAINADGYNHFVIFRGVWGNRVLLADPAWGNRTMPAEKFESIWLDYPEFGRVGFVVKRSEGNNVGRPFGQRRSIPLVGYLAARRQCWRLSP